jgi:hypothetical protein
MEARMGFLLQGVLSKGKEAKWESSSSQTNLLSHQVIIVKGIDIKVRIGLPLQEVTNPTFQQLAILRGTGQVITYRDRIRTFLRVTPT